MLASPGAVLLLRESFRSVPRELIDAARIDGAGHMRILTRIVLPASRPTLAALILITAVNQWNSFMWPRIIANQRPRVVTVATAALQFHHNAGRIHMMAAAVVVLIPVVVLLLVLRGRVGGGALLGRLLRVERQTRVLVTYGTAICGASAIATMSAVIGASSSAIAFSITVIVIYNVLGALLFPPLGHLLGLSQEAFGLWAGTAVNDTSSVVAAATVYGAAAASYAVVVKLTRTLAIIPLAVFESWRRYRSASGAEQAARPVWYKLAPPFLGFFLLAAALNSLGAIPPSWQGTIKLMAHFGTTAAMAAVGMTSSFAAIRQAGWRPIALGGILWVLVATSSLLLDMIRTAW